MKVQTKETFIDLWNQNRIQILKLCFQQLKHY